MQKALCGEEGQGASQWPRKGQVLTEREMWSPDRQTWVQNGGTKCAKNVEVPAEFSDWPMKIILTIREKLKDWFGPKSWVGVWRSRTLSFNPLRKMSILFNDADIAC